MDPDYYKCPNKDYKIEVFDIINGWNLFSNFYLANVLKYILRIGKSRNIKTRIQDLEKARTYLTKEIERLQGEQK